VGNREPKRLSDSLCGGSRSEKLTSASGRRTGPAACFRGFLESDQSVCKTRPDSLDESCILAALRGKRNAAWNNRRRAVVQSGERHHHRGEAFIARRNAHHGLARWQ